MLVFQDDKRKIPRLERQRYDTEGEDLLLVDISTCLSHSLSVIIPTMQINQDAPPGKEWIVDERHYVCPYHRLSHPSGTPNYAGCTCSSSYMRKLVDKKKT